MKKDPVTAGMVVLLTMCFCAIVAMGAVLIHKDIENEALQLQIVYVNNLSNIQYENIRREQQELRMIFAEFQHWRVGITLASRQGWAAANRYIVDNPFPGRNYYYDTTVGY